MNKGGLYVIWFLKAVVECMPMSRQDEIDDEWSSELKPIAKSSKDPWMVGLLKRTGPESVGVLLHQ